MKKICLLVVVLILLSVAHPVKAAEWAETSHTWYGDPNPLPLNRLVFKGVLVENSDKEKVAHNMGYTFNYIGPWYPHEDDTLVLKKFVVYKNGQKICSFGQKDLVQGPVTCMVGDLYPGETMDAKVFFKSHAAGEFELGVTVYHDGISTGGAHIATFQ